MKNRCAFRKKIMIFYKLLKVASLLENATEFARYPKTFKVKNLSFLQKIDGFFERKILTFWKIARASKVAEECDWKRKNSQKVQS